MTKQTARIVLLEDELLIGAMLTEILEDFGFENVTHVTTVTRAIEEMHHSPVDLCIFDVFLNGDTCSQAVCEANNLKIPVVLMSGYSDSSHLDVHPDRFIFLEKPAEPDDLNHAAISLLSAGAKIEQVGGTLTAR